MPAQCARVIAVVMLKLSILLILSSLVSSCSFNMATGSISTRSAKEVSESIDKQIKFKEGQLSFARRAKWNKTIPILEKEIKQLKKKKRYEFFTVDSDGKY